MTLLTISRAAQSPSLSLPILSDGSGKDFTFLPHVDELNSTVVCCDHILSPPACTRQGSGS